MMSDPVSSSPGKPKSRSRRAPIGAAPGTLIADPQALEPIIDVVAYGPDELQEQRLSSPNEANAYLEKSPVTWINVYGLGDPAVPEAFGEMFRLHRLALEDVLNVHQRAKVEDYETSAFVVLRMPLTGNRFDTEQLSIFVGERFVLTFQEKPGDCFGLVRERLRKGHRRIRERGADYLTYCLIDAVTDSYFPILESYGEKVESLEDALTAGRRGNPVPEIHRLKRDLLNVRRAVWPLREMVNSLIRDDVSFVQDQTKVYIRDCYDHAAQLMDMIETYREVASGLIELHLSTVSNRLNEVMKVLTIIATIFIPLSFIAGVYGMNFDAGKLPWNMPELGWYFGYPFALGLMAAVAGGLLFYFRRRGWIGEPREYRKRQRRTSQSVR